MADRTTVCVVGAGMGGLALTHHLAERGIDSVTLEATSEPGGVVASVERADTVLEVGPQRLRLTDGLADLVTAAGLEDAVVRADPELPVYVYADGLLREVPRSAAALLRTDLLSVRGRLRALAEPLTAPIDGAETAAEAFSRKFGAEAYENLVEPLFGGTYASDPAEMPAAHALAPLAALEEREGSLLRAALRRLRGGDVPPPVTFEGGNQRLATALADRYADRLRLETPATGLGTDGDGSVVETPEGRIRADEVVLTAPARVAAALLSTVADGACGLADLAYNPLALAHLRTAEPLGRAGLGYQVRRSEPLHTLGVTWNGAFGRDRLVTCFLGGMSEPEVVEWTERRIGAVAAAEFERVAGLDARPVHVRRWPDAIPAYDHSWTALDHLSLPEGVHLCTNYTGRLGVPARVREADRLAETLAARVDGRAASAPAPS